MSARRPIENHRRLPQATISCVPMPGPVVQFDQLEIHGSDTRWCPSQPNGITVCELSQWMFCNTITPTAAALLPSGDRVAGPEHDDFRADWRAVVEIDDVLVRQADTAGRDVGANGPGFIGAVDAV